MRCGRLRTERGRGVRGIRKRDLDPKIRRRICQGWHMGRKCVGDWLLGRERGY